MHEVFEENGTVTSSAELRFDDVDKFQQIRGPMVGMILRVNVSDDQDNRTASDSPSKRGYRHECTVVITNFKTMQPFLVLENVVIPPGRHSGIDDFDEDLPRGMTTHLDGKEISTYWKHLDISRLDGEYCVVGFIGGNIDYPYIQNWWPHPANRFDPATSGKEKFLNQYDSGKCLSRATRRVNGVIWLVTREGDIYVNTNEANSIVEAASNKKYNRKLKPKGGHVQIDIKKGKQLEVNWNTLIEGLQAGSDDKREQDLFHADHGEASEITTLPKRETTRTYFRHKEFEMLEKTSDYGVVCENTEVSGGKKGIYHILADDEVLIVQQTGGAPVATLDMTGGKLVITTVADTTISSTANVAVTAAAAITEFAPSVVLGAPFPASQPLVQHTPWLATWNALITELDIQKQAYDPTKPPPPNPASTDYYKLIDLLDKVAVAFAAACTKIVIGA
jgi:hypothetical protein